ncbi:hypothetical protein BDN70DRAFT_998919 [Pholiota conissans]|uniref:Uncharacterized protein n=1 Tax=Pholiota conissans TaxID=109636 RepID=A0A9P6CQS6_9AGAR|nr:hypothetical protein BDN70DRAFT_998919 [Pholiota conissans]
MIIILLFLACIGTLRDTPLSTQLESQTEIFVPSTRDIPRAPYGQRTINGIIISCFATIFACTWSAIHPNIPSPMDCGWTRLKRQFLTMLCALLAPELITAWALRQYWAAKELVESYNRDMSDYITTDVISSKFFQDSALADYQNGKGSRWTLTHGFFLQMGGFMLCEDGKPVDILCGGDSSKGIKYFIQNGIIPPPKITEEDIQERSKGDTISKVLIILQTTWFAVQCIARWSQRLPVTELEVVTLAYALLNGITYALWWKKPQNVGRPVFLEAQKPLNEDRDSDSSLISYDTGSQVRKMLHDILQTPPWRIPLKLLGIPIRPLGKLFSDFYEQMKDHELRPEQHLLLQSLVLSLVVYT